MQGVLNLVIYLNRTPIFEWCMVMFRSRNGCQKRYASEEYGSWLFHVHLQTREFFNLSIMSSISLVVINNKWLVTRVLCFIVIMHAWRVLVGGPTKAKHWLISENT